MAKRSRRQLISSDEAVPRAEQHTQPCSDCPWSKTALPGWLGGVPLETWLKEAHGDAVVPCHTCGNQQCAGIAIYRRNVCKSSRDPTALRLPADREKVFASPQEFREYHQPCTESK